MGMRISFKQRSIEHKITVFDRLIGHWVKMRNFVFSGVDPRELETYRAFDQMYGESQQFIGEAVLICEDVALTEEINSLNEGLYRTEWAKLTEEEVNQRMEHFKIDALQLIERMRDDIKQSTRLELDDYLYVFSGFKRRNRKTQDREIP
jgi:hypothetical protein